MDDRSRWHVIAGVNRTGRSGAVKAGLSMLLLALIVVVLAATVVLSALVDAPRYPSSPDERRDLDLRRRH